MKGNSFRPVKSASRFLVAPNVFEFKLGSGEVLLCIFNYDGWDRTFEVEKAATLLKDGEWSGKNVWTGEEINDKADNGSILKFTLPSGTSQLLQFDACSE